MTAQTSTNAGLSTRRMVMPDRGYARIAGLALNYALALIFLWFGLLKFTAFEASGIAPLIINSPLVSWWLGVFGVGGTAKMLGVVEITTGVLIAARPFQPRLGVIGGVMAVLTFLITLTFLFSTPGAVQPGSGSPFALSPMPGQFLLKDLVLLCASFFVLAASLDEMRSARA